MRPTVAPERLPRHGYETQGDTVNQQVSDFIAWHRARTLRKTGAEPAASTLRSKQYRLHAALRAAGTDDLSVLGTLIQDRDAVECLFDRLALRMSTGSLANVVDTLFDFAEYAKAQGWCSHPALEKADRPGHNHQKPITVYTADELEVLLANARGFGGLRWWVFLETMAGTGRRVGELLALQWTWLDLGATPPNFHLPHTKNKRQAYVPLTKHLATQVFTPDTEHALRTETRAYKNQAFGNDPATYVFPWSYQSANKRFRRYCKVLGVPDRGFHNFRHTRATALLVKGVPIHAVSALIGHANVSTTDRIYNHANALAYASYLE